MSRILLKDAEDFIDFLSKLHDQLGTTDEVYSVLLTSVVQISYEIRTPKIEDNLLRQISCFWWHQSWNDYQPE